MVRRAVAQHLGKFATAVGDAELLQTDVLSVFGELTQDGAPTTDSRPPLRGT
jgi:hypothetical protein